MTGLNPAQLDAVRLMSRKDGITTQAAQRELDLNAVKVNAVFNAATNWKVRLAKLRRDTVFEFGTTVDGGQLFKVYKLRPVAVEVLQSL